jgi:histone H1/5
MAETAAPAAAPKASPAPKAKAPRKPSKNAGKYTGYIVDAISSLKERTGSSVPAIVKFIGAKYGKDLTAGWEKTVAQVLKTFTKTGKVVKVKASYKVRGPPAAPRGPRGPGR